MSDVTSVESSVPAAQEWEETPDLFGAYPRLTEDQIATLLPGGSRRPVAVDEILIREGTRSDELFVILSGKVAIVTDDESGERRVLRVHGPGRFLGELGDLEGQPAFYTAVVVVECDVLAVPTSRVRALVAHDQFLSDLVLRAYLVRRSLLIGQRVGLRIIGSCFSPDTARLRELPPATDYHTDGWIWNVTATLSGCCTVSAFRPKTRRW